MTSREGSRPDLRASQLGAIPLFRGLDWGELEELAKHAREKTLPKHSPVLSAGEPGDALYLIISGAVKVFRLSPAGQEQILAILGPGECVGEMALLDGGLRSASAETLTETGLLVLPRLAFLSALRRQPAIAEKLLVVLSKRLQVANHQLEQLVFCDARGRVAGTLLALAEVYGTGPAGQRRIDLTLTHQELANLAGIARETGTRVLSELAEARLIESDGRKLVLRDEEGLRELVSRV